MPYISYSDEHLCDLLKEDDEKAMEVLLNRYWEPLYKMTVSVLDDVLLCEDIIQEGFIKIWNDRKSLRFTHSIKAYLFAAVRYEVYRQVKRGMRKVEQMASYEPRFVEFYNPQKKLELEELMERVEWIVNQLPDRCREIYQLSRKDNLSRKEIASRLNVSTKTVENQLTIALRRIRVGISKILFLLFF